jgi:hypothetical protein
LAENLVLEVIGFLLVWICRLPRELSCEFLVTRVWGGQVRGRHRLHFDRYQAENGYCR